MSASVVDQFETEIRIAAMPCHVVPPSQHVPSAWTAAMTRAGEVVGVLVLPPPGGENRTRTWLRTTSLRIVTPGASRSAVGHPAGQRAAALDHLGEAVPTELAQRRVDREARARRDDSATQLYGSRSPPAVST